MSTIQELGRLHRTGPAPAVEVAATNTAFNTDYNEAPAARP